MSRFNLTEFAFAFILDPDGVTEHPRALCTHPAFAPKPLVFDETALKTVYTPAQLTALHGLLQLLFAAAETSAKGILDAQRAALNTP